MMDKIEFLLSDSADLLETLKKCELVDQNAAIEWFDKKLTPAQSACVASGLGVYMAIQNIKNATADKRTEAIIAFVNALDGAWTTCL